MNFRNDICKRIKDLREKKGVLQRDVANALNISLSAYTKLENGERGISSENCIALADYFKVTCDYILRGIEVENVDVCTRTCLKQESIDVCADVSKEQHEAIQQYISASKQYQSALAADCTLSDCNFHFRCVKKERSRLLHSNALAYIINSLISDGEFMEEISHAVADAYSSTCSYLSELFDDDYIIHSDDYLVDSDSTYRKFINASCYVAGSAFSDFFLKMVKCEDFLLCVGANDPFGPSKQCIENAQKEFWTE